MQSNDTNTAPLPHVGSTAELGKLPSACGLTECHGKPMCPLCERRKARDDGMPGDPDERHLRRLLAVRVGMPGTYYDDGEAHGTEHGISIDFMREPVAHIDAKLRALNVARYECSKSPNVRAKRV
jgi:hypothetical protein